MSKKLARLLSGLFVSMVAATIVSVATPAHAAYATCNVSGTIYNHDNVLTAIPKNSTTGVTCQMRNGNYDNNAVRVLQTSLNKCYYFNLVVDGDFGTATENAVRYVQRVEGVTETGVYDPTLRVNMRWFPKDQAICAYVD
ncbi:peptidoglycan-binding protein [Catellatospora bangladeshensis]|uniref:Peptidoglycan-binding protein n=1 Tax=Catellatospora bangladeshensis TaxID=310355 RepID=A0A8J3NLE2_9ACTN|nr:peptidoglycan-binding domain-containing protein [Catellatospora bangladeshensis]GIF84927.1 peptidoglycan-binding protein [Catellatospora bangladeshensis]